MKTIELIVLLTFCTIECFSTELPSFIHVCHRTDPNLEQCLIAAIEEVRPYLVKGVPEYSIPSLEPLVLHDLISEEAVGLKIQTTHVDTYGCSNFSVTGLQIDKESHVYTIDIEIPTLRIQAHYNVDGKLLVLPIKGNGEMEANVTDVVATCILQGELYEKEDTYLRFVSANLKAKVGGGNVRLENLFNGDKVLLKAVNDVVNKNLDAFLKELMPVIERALAGVFLEIANDLAQGYTFDQLFPL